MAIYHLNLKVISRSKGQSATAAAAYRAGQKIYDQRTGITFDYTHKQGVDATEILAPDKVPEWVCDRSSLWNKVELFEKRKNSRVAREFDIALPRELNNTQQRELVKGFVTQELISQSLVADIAYHNIDSHNPHVHIMVTTRRINQQGFGVKLRYLDKKDFLLKIRESWQNHANQALEAVAATERIDHRSLEEQGSNYIPQIHLGANVVSMMKKGIKTQREERYQKILEANEQIKLREREIEKINQEIIAEQSRNKAQNLDKIRQKQLQWLASVETVKRVMRVVSCEQQDGWLQWEVNTYLFKIRPDFLSGEIWEKTGRGRILRFDGRKMTGDLNVDDLDKFRRMDEVVSQYIHQHKREKTLEQPLSNKTVVSERSKDDELTL